MPILPSSERERRAYPNDRRASSPKRENDVTKTKQQLVTKAVYDAVLKGADTETNLKIKRLCQGRNRIYQAILMVDGALKDWNPQINPQPSGTYNALRQTHRELERAFLKFPLQIENR